MDFKKIRSFVLPEKKPFGKKEKIILGIRIVAVAVLAMLVAIVYYNLIDRRLMRRRARVIKATGSSVYEGASAEAEKGAAEKGGEDA